MVEDGANVFNVVVSGYFDPLVATRTYYDTGAFKISFGEGNLSDMRASSFTYNNIAAAAIAVYTNTGALYTV